MMNKIYTASKACHRPTWRGYRDLGLMITSRWIDVDDSYIGSNLPDHYDTSKLWTQCVADVLAADVLVLYWLKGERLKGALVEVGCAFAVDTPVIMCGDTPTADEGSWMGHPLCFDQTGMPIDLAMGFAAGFDRSVYLK